MKIVNFLLSKKVLLYDNSTTMQQYEYVDGGEMGPAKIARIVFSGPPRPAGTVQLGLEGCAPPDASPEMQSQTLSEVLMIMFLEGVKVRHGEDMRPENLTPTQIEALSEYMNSFGFYLLVKTNDLDQPPPILKRPKTELKDFHERFYDFDRGLWHEVSFDWAPIISAVPQAGHPMIHKTI